MKYELTNLSVIVVIKVDSEDRIRNLNYILDYYNQYFKGVEIVILEQGEQQLFFKQEGTSNLENTIVYHFIKDNGPHYKTRNLNLATRLATRKIIMMTDTDVFVEPKVLSKALCKMEKESSAILSPHNGVMVEVSKSFFSLNSKSELLDSLVFFPRSFKQKMDQFDLSNIYPIYGGEYFSTGGCILYHKDVFNLIGGWNTNIISYGYEDMEFVYRAKKLGFKHISFRKNNIYHLQHFRGLDSRYNSFCKINRQEWDIVRSMNAEELMLYALNGFRRLRFDSDVEYNYTNHSSEYSLTVVNNSKVDLRHSSILVLLENVSENGRHVVDFYLEYMEMNFKNFEINIVEKGSNRCDMLKNKLGVKYSYYINKKNIAFDAFFESIINSINNQVLLLWDHYSFIQPEKLKNIFNRYTKTQSKVFEIVDDGWKPDNIWRAREFGNGLIIMSREYLLSCLGNDEFGSAKLFQHLKQTL